MLVLLQSASHTRQRPTGQNVLTTEVPEILPAYDGHLHPGIRF